MLSKGLVFKKSLEFSALNHLEWLKAQLCVKI